MISFFFSTQKNVRFDTHCSPQCGKCPGLRTRGVSCCTSTNTREWKANVISKKILLIWRPDAKETSFPTFTLFYKPLSKRHARCQSFENHDTCKVKIGHARGKEVPHFEKVESAQIRIISKEYFLTFTSETLLLTTCLQYFGNPFLHYSQTNNLIIRWIFDGFINILSGKIIVFHSSNPGSAAALTERIFHIILEANPSGGKAADAKVGVARHGAVEEDKVS